MQLLVDIKNDSIADEIIQMLSAFKHEGVEIKQNIFQKNQSKLPKEEDFSDQYIEEHWQDVVSIALRDYDDNYTRSFQYKIDRADFRDMKEGV